MLHYLTDYDIHILEEFYQGTRDSIPDSVKINIYEMLNYTRHYQEGKFKKVADKMINITLGTDALEFKNIIQYILDINNVILKLVKRELTKLRTLTNTYLHFYTDNQDIITFDNRVNYAINKLNSQADPNEIDTIKSYVYMMDTLVKDIKLTVYSNAQLNKNFKEK